jgi:5-methylthioadenosine/S-adenosylhomocysteine deaminase
MVVARERVSMPLRVFATRKSNCWERLMQEKEHERNTHVPKAGDGGSKSSDVSRRCLLRASAAGALAGAATGQVLGSSALAQGAANNEVLDQLGRDRPDKTRPILIKGGMVLSMDRAVGDFTTADVLIEGTKIKEVRPNIAVSNAAVVDAKGTVVMPGFVDTHLHMFQTNLRAFFADAAYFQSSLYQDYRRAAAPGGAFEHYEPEDAYLGQYVGALGNINGGVTTVCDMSQISNTPAHSDACVRAFTDSGLRTVFALSPPPGNAGANSAYPQDIRRLKQRYFSSTDQLITLALQPGLNVANFQLAREVGVPIFQHVNTADLGLELEALAMGPDCTYVHVTLLNKSTWRKIADTGGKVSLSTIAESTVGVGTPAIQDAIDAGVLARTSFGTDAETFMTCDFFSQMRTAFSTQRLLALRASNNGTVNKPVPISCREVLEMATIGGARGANLQDKIGSLTPGKEADIIMLRTDRINVSPVCNVPGAIVTLMDTSNVDTVFVGGNALKWAGQLVGVNIGQVLDRITESRDGILRRTGWSLDLFGTCCVHP